MVFGEEHDEFVLGLVGVLELVDEDVTEAALVVLEHRVVGLEDVDGDHEQVVEVHGASGQQALLVLAVDIGDLAFVRTMRVVFVRVEVDQLVLGAGDHRVHGAGREPLGVEAEVAQHIAGETYGVGLVVDRERGAVAELGRFTAQDADAGRVEGRHPHLLGDRSDQRGDAVLHLVGRLVGERDGEDLERRDARLGDQPRHPVGEHAGLARTRPSHDQERPARVGHGLALHWVETGEIERHVAVQANGGVIRGACTTGSHI